MHPNKTVPCFRVLLKSYVAASTCAVGVAVGLNKATSVSLSTANSIRTYNY